MSCHVRRYADERGHVACCACGWRVVHPNPVVVRTAADRHDPTQEAHRED